MKEKSEMPSKTLDVVIGENKYTIKFPSNGQLIDIEAMRQTMSQGQMDNILLTRSRRSSLVYVTIDMIAYFTVLIPDLKKDMRVNSLLELSPMDTKELKNLYITQFSPWFDKWMDIINSDFQADPDEKKEEKEDEDLITTGK